MTDKQLLIDKQDESRRLFENWMSDGGKFPKAIERSGDGSYKLMQAHSAWTAWSAALDAALAQPAAHGDIEKFKHHSIILNQFCWRISEALGDIGASQDSAYLDISALMDRAVSAISQPQQQARVTDEVVNKFIAAANAASAAISDICDPITLGDADYECRRVMRAALEAIADQFAGGAK